MKAMTYKELELETARRWLADKEFAKVWDCFDSPEELLEYAKPGNPDPSAWLDEAMTDGESWTREDFVKFHGDPGVDFDCATAFINDEVEKTFGDAIVSLEKAQRDEDGVIVDYEEVGYVIL